jgi:hypothetical protein
MRWSIRSRMSFHCQVFVSVRIHVQWCSSHSITYASIPSALCLVVHCLALCLPPRYSLLYMLSFLFALSLNRFLSRHAYPVPLKQLRHVLDQMRRCTMLALLLMSLLPFSHPKLTEIEHHSTRSRPLDIHNRLRLSGFEFALRGLGWCCELD